MFISRTTREERVTIETALDSAFLKIDQAEQLIYDLIDAFLSDREQKTLDKHDAQTIRNSAATPAGAFSFSYRIGATSRNDGQRTNRARLYGLFLRCLPTKKLVEYAEVNQILCPNANRWDLPRRD